MTIEPQELTPVQQAEIAAIADAMARSFHNRVKYYIREFKLPPTEALERASEYRKSDAWIEQVKETPSRQISWDELGDLEECEPGAALQKWQAVKADAQAYYRSGQMVADAMQGDEPWMRARFFAIRQELMRDWQPRNGIEQSLIDQMAICFGRFLEWQTALTNWTDFADFNKQTDKLPRLSAAEALERAANMLDRFNRMFLRTLRALRDLRRYNAPVIVHNAGQVNVANQQVNVAEFKTEQP